MPIPDQFHHLLQKLIEKEQPQNMEELRQLMNSLMGKELPEIPEEDLTDADRAKALVWEAYDLPVAKGRRRAKKALELDPDCIEAYEYLGNSYQYYHKSKTYFKKGVEIGRRIFGGKFLKENKGHFWGITETRPFMRCLAGLADCYYGPGQTPKAIELMEEMIELNPGDNQGTRYWLLAALLEVKDLKRYNHYRKQYNEKTAMMTYNDALYQFMKDGPSKKTNVNLHQAFRKNSHVPPILLAEYPPQTQPEAYSFGSKEEALIYAGFAWRAWLWAEGAKDWLRQQWIA